MENCANGKMNTHKETVISKKLIIKEAFKDCDGCAVKNLCYDNYINEVYEIHFKDGVHKCPCKICLVKMICSEICEAYDKAWSRKISEER